MNIRKNKILKVIATVLVVTLLCEDIARANRFSSAQPAPQANALTHQIPDSYGVITEELSGKGEEVIFNIQDAHASMGCQRSIVGILDSLVTNYTIDMIAVEGSEGRIDTSILSAFPDKKIKEAAADHFLQSGKMSAAEFFTVINGSEIPVYGVEDSRLYINNTKAFRKVIEHQATRAESAEKLLAIFKDLSTHVYSKTLLAAEKKKDAFQAGEMSALKYIAYLIKLAKTRGLRISQDTPGYKNVSVIAKTVSMVDAIDFPNAESERKKLIETLGKICSESDTKWLISASINLRMGKLSPFDYHSQLLSLASAYAVDRSEYKDLVGYTKYLELFGTIDVRELYAEIGLLESATREKLFENEEEKALASFINDLTLLKDLIETTLSSENLQEINANRARFRKDRFTRYIGKMLKEHRITCGGISDDVDTVLGGVEDALEFYALAKERDMAMFANTVKRMREKGDRSAALITGGFHKDGLSRMFADKDISYIVVLPKWDEKSFDRPYVTILTNKAEKYIDQIKNDKTLAVHSFFSTSHDILKALRHEKEIDLYVHALGFCLGHAVLDGLDYRELLKKDGPYRSNLEKMLSSPDIPDTHRREVLAFFEEVSRPGNLVIKKNENGINTAVEIYLNMKDRPSCGFTVRKNKTGGVILTPIKDLSGKSTADLGPQLMQDGKDAESYIRSSQVLTSERPASPDKEKYAILARGSIREKSIEFSDPKGTRYSELLERLIIPILKKRPDIKNIKINIVTGSGTIFTTHRNKRTIDIDQRLLDAILNAQTKYPKEITDEIGRWIIDHDIRQRLVYQEFITRGPPPKIDHLANVLIDIRDFLLLSEEAKNALVSVLNSVNGHGVDAYSLTTVLNEAQRRFEKKVEKGANPGPAAKATALSMLSLVLKFYGLKRVSAKSLRERVKLAYGIIDRAERMQFLKSIGADLKLKYVRRLINSRIDLEKRADFLKMHDVPVTAKTLGLSGNKITELSNRLEQEKIRKQIAQEANEVLHSFSPEKQNHFMENIALQYSEKISKVELPRTSDKVDLLMTLVTEGLAVYATSDLKTPDIVSIVQFIKEKVAGEEDFSGLSREERARKIEEINRQVEQRVDYYFTKEGEENIRQLAGKYLYKDGISVLKQTLSTTVLWDTQDQGKSLWDKLSDSQLNEINEALIEESLALLHLEWSKFKHKRSDAGYSNEQSIIERAMAEARKKDAEKRVNTLVEILVEDIERTYPELIVPEEEETSSAPTQGETSSFKRMLGTVILMSVAAGLSAGCAASISSLGDTPSPYVQQHTIEHETGTSAVEQSPQIDIAPAYQAKGSLSSMIQHVLSFGRDIRQAEERLRLSELRRELAGSGTFFWDIMLRYGSSNKNRFVNARAERTIEDARDTALELSDRKRELQEDMAALANDRAQLAAAVQELNEDLAALANDQAQLAEAMAALENDLRQLEEAIAAGDEERIKKELAEIAEDRARIEKEKQEIADNEEEIANGRARIEQEEQEIADNEEEIENGRAKISALETKLKKLQEEIEMLQAPELRLRSDIGAVILDTEKHRNVEARKAIERQDRISLEQAKVDVVISLVRLYGDGISAQKKIESLTHYLSSLESIREKTPTHSLTAEEIVTLDMRIAQAKSELTGQRKALLDVKSQIRYIMGWPGEEDFVLDEKDLASDRLKAILSRSEIDMSKYYSFLLAEKGEEIEYYQALVPKGVFEYFDLNVDAVWQQDLLRQVLYDGLRDDAFLGLRAQAVFGDEGAAKRNQEAFLSYLKAIDEYKLIKRTLDIASQSAAFAINMLSSAYRNEQTDIARQAAAEVEDMRARYEAGLENLRAFLNVIEETKDENIRQANLGRSLLDAQIDFSKSQASTTNMDLDELSGQNLEEILRLMNVYKEHLEEKEYEPLERLWKQINGYLPGLTMPLDKRLINDYINEIESFKTLMGHITVEERKSVKELVAYIEYFLSAEDRMALKDLSEQFKAGRERKGFLHFGRRQKDETEMTGIIDQIHSLLPIAGIPEDTSPQERISFTESKLPLIRHALDLATYSVRQPSIREMFSIACARGKMDPANRAVDIARNNARPNAALFKPIINVNLSVGASTNISDPRFELSNLLDMGISLEIPLYNPSIQYQAMAGKEFLVSAEIKRRLAERHLEEDIVRQLVSMHSLMEREANLSKFVEDLKRRIKTLKARPDTPKTEIARLNRQKETVLLNLKYALLQLEIEKNNLRDAMGLEGRDTIMLENISNADIERVLSAFKASMEGNFVASSASELVPVGSMVTIGPKQELAVNNVTTDLIVSGIQDIRYIALRDSNDDYLGQVALEGDTVIASDIKKIQEGYTISIKEDGTVLIRKPDREALENMQIKVGDIAHRYKVALTHVNGKRAGDILIETRTGEEALNRAIHRSNRRGYALTSVAIVKEGDAFSIVFSVSPLSLGSSVPITFVYPKLPDSWLDWDGLGIFNIPGFLTGAHARQQRRAVLSNVAMQEAKRSDLLIKKGEELAAVQRQNVIKLFQLSQRQATLASAALLSCEEEIARLQSQQKNLPSLRPLERLKTRKVRLENERDQAQNNLINIKILMSAMGISEDSVPTEAGESAPIGIDEALSKVGQRTDDELNRIDVAIAEEMQKLTSSARMFEQEANIGAFSYEGGESFALETSLSFRLNTIHGASIAKLEREDAEILAASSIETAKDEVLRLYETYATSLVRLRAQEFKIKGIERLINTARQSKGKPLHSRQELESAQIDLERLKIAHSRLEQTLSMAIADLSMVIEARTGVFLQPSLLIPQNIVDIDIEELDQKFRQYADHSADKIVKHIQNLREQARLKESQAWWTLFPRLSIETAYGDVNDLDITFEASTRIMGSGRAVKAKIEELKQKYLKEAEKDRLKELEYEWNLIMNDLNTALKERRDLKEALYAMETQVKYVIEQRIADYSLRGGSTSQNLIRLMNEYEDIKLRYLESNIRLNTSYALASSILTRLGISEADLGKPMDSLTPPKESVARKDIDAIIAYYARLYKKDFYLNSTESINPFIIAAIETGFTFKSNLKSHRGALGLFQILPDNLTRAQWGYNARTTGADYVGYDLYDPEVNAKVFVWLVKQAKEELASLGLPLTIENFIWLYHDGSQYVKEGKKSKYIKGYVEKYKELASSGKYNFNGEELLAMHGDLVPGMLRQARTFEPAQKQPRQEKVVPQRALAFGEQRTIENMHYVGVPVTVRKGDTIYELVRRQNRNLSQKNLIQLLKVTIELNKDVLFNPDPERLKSGSYNVISSKQIGKTLIVPTYGETEQVNDTEIVPLAEEPADIQSTGAQAYTDFLAQLEQTKIVEEKEMALFTDLLKQYDIARIEDILKNKKVLETLELYRSLWQVDAAIPVVCQLQKKLGIPDNANVRGMNADGQFGVYTLVHLLIATNRADDKAEIEALQKALEVEQTGAFDFATYRALRDLYYVQRSKETQHGVLTTTVQSGVTGLAAETVARMGEVNEHRDGNLRGKKEKRAEVEQLPAHQKAVEQPPQLSEDQAWIRNDSPVYISYMAAHPENVYPDGWVMQELEEEQSKRDASDWIHIQNRTRRSFNAADELFFYDKDGTLRPLRWFAGGNDVTLTPQGTRRSVIRIAFSKMVPKSKRGEIVLVNQGINKDGETVNVYDRDGNVLARARNRAHRRHMEDVTVFEAENKTGLIHADPTQKRANLEELNKVSHRVADFQTEKPAAVPATQEKTEPVPAKGHEAPAIVPSAKVETRPTPTTEEKTEPAPVKRHEAPPAVESADREVKPEHGTSIKEKGFWPLSALKQAIDRVYRDIDTDRTENTGTAMRSDLKPVEGQGQFTIREILPEGSIVRKGDPVYTFDSSALEKRRDSLRKLANETRLAIAEAREIIAEHERAKNSLAEQYEKDRKAIEQKIKSGQDMQQLARERIVSAERTCAALEERAERLRLLTEKKLVAPDEYSASIEAVHAAQEVRSRAYADLETANRIVREAQNEMQSLQSRREQENNRLNAIIERATIAQQREAEKLKEQLEELKVVETNIAKSTAYAPRDGKVVYSHIGGAYVFGYPVQAAVQTFIRPGSAIAHGQEVVRIVDVERESGDQAARPKNIITSEASTGFSNQQGSIGLPIMKIVPEGTHVQIDDVIAVLDDSFLRDTLRQKQADLLQTRRVIAQTITLSEETEQSLLAEIELYQARLKNAQAVLEEAKAIHAAKERKSSAAKERSAFLKRKYEELKERANASEDLVIRTRAAYDTAVTEEKIALYEEASALLRRTQTLNVLQRLYYEHQLRVSQLKRTLKVARETRRLAEENEVADQRAVDFYQSQINNCLIRATRAGKVYYLNDRNIITSGGGARMAQNTFLVGQGAIVNPGMPLVKIVEEQESVEPRGIWKHVINTPEKRPHESIERVICNIRPLQLYNITGYGATLTYAIPNGSTVRKGTKIAEFDTSALERERAMQLERINDTSFALDEAKALAEEARRHKEALSIQHEKDTDAAEAKIQAGQTMLRQATEKIKHAENNVLLAQKEVERLRALGDQGIRVALELQEAVLVLNDAKRALCESQEEEATARGMLEQGKAELKALEARMSVEHIRLDAVIKRALSDQHALEEKLKLDIQRKQMIETNIENSTVYAVRDGVVIYSNVTGIGVVHPVPRNIVIGPGITIGYGQEFMRIVEPESEEGIQQAEANNVKVTLVGSDVSTAFDSGSGVIYPGIKKIYVTDGDYVEKGERLWELETSALETLQREAQIQLNATERLINERSFLLNQAERRAQTYKEHEYPALVRQARALLMKAEADYKARKETRIAREAIVVVKKEELKAQQRANTGSLAAQRIIEESQYAFNSASMEAKTALLREAQAFSALARAKADLERIEYDHAVRLASYEREINTLRAGLNGAGAARERTRKRIEFYREQIKNSIKHAPVSGRVSFINDRVLSVLGIVLKQVPRERIIGEGAIASPGPLMKITAGAEGDDPSPTEGLIVASDGASQAGTPLLCDIHPVDFGRRGEHGSMILHIAPEGRVSKGQLLVEFDLSGQERLMENWQEMKKQAQHIHTIAAQRIAALKEKRRILNERLSRLRAMYKARVRGTENMVDRARESMGLAEDNLTLARLNVVRSGELFDAGILSQSDLNQLRIVLEEESMVRHRALREAANADLRYEEGTSGFLVIEAQIEQERAVLNGEIEIAQNQRQTAAEDISIYSKMISVVQANKKKAAIYAQEDGWIRYAHNTGSTLLGVPITSVSNPVYIGVGAVVKNGQPVIHFFTEKPEAEQSVSSETSSAGIPVKTNVRLRNSDRTGPLGARILEVSKKDGDLVTEGQTLLRFDPSELEDRKRQEEERLIEHRQLVQTSLSLRKEAETQLEEYLSREYPSIEEQARALVSEREALAQRLKDIAVNAGKTARLRETEYSSLKESSNAAVTDVEIQEAKAAWNQARIRHKRALYYYELATVALEEAKSNLNILKSERDIRVAELKMRIEEARANEMAARERIAIIEADIAYYDEQIKNCVVQAPASGKLVFNNSVSYRFLVDVRVPRDIIIQPGVELPPGVTIAKIMDPEYDALELESSRYRPSPIAKLSFFVLVVSLGLLLFRKIRSIIWLAKYEDPRTQGPPDTQKIKSEESSDVDNTPDNTVQQPGATKPTEDSPGDINGETQLKQDTSNDPEQNTETKKHGKRGPPKEPFFLSLVLLLTPILVGFTNTTFASTASVDSAAAPLYSLYQSLSQTHPALSVFFFVGVILLVMIAVSYFLTMNKYNRRESAARMQVFAKRPGIFIAFAVGLAAATFIYPGIPSYDSWQQAIEVLKILSVAMVFVTYPLSIAGSYIIGFIQKLTILRVRVPFLTGVAKLRHNSVAMEQSEGIKRLFKWWAIIAAIGALLTFIMPIFISVPVIQGPSLTLVYVVNMASSLYTEAAATLPFLHVLRWVVVVLVFSALIELILKRKTGLLRDDDSWPKRTVSKVAIMLLIGAGLTIASPLLPAFMSFPGSVSALDLFQGLETIVIFTILVWFYRNICTYLLTLHSKRINHIYQAPPLFNFIISRFRNNLPRLTVLWRMMMFTYSLMATELILSRVSGLFGTSILSHVASWYLPFSERHPGINVFSWLGFTVLIAVTTEKLYNIVTKKNPALQSTIVKKNIKFLSFITGAVLTSFFLVSFPSLAAWSEFTAWSIILIMAIVVAVIPNQITGGFFLGVFARRLYIRVIVPFMVHLKTRIRELELPQTEAALRLFGIWKWSIAGGVGLLSLAPLLFSLAGPGGEIGSSTLTFIYNKTIQWYTILIDKWPFIKALHWIGVIVVLASIVEIAIKKITKTIGKFSIFHGDEYAVNRLTTKFVAVMLTLGIALFSPLLLPISSVGLSFSIIMITVLAAIEFMLHIVSYYSEDNTKNQQKFKKKLSRGIHIMRALSLTVMAAGLLFLAAHFPLSTAWTSLVPALATGAWYAGIIGMYLMIGGFILGMFITRINRVFQPLFSFFLLITRWRSKAPAMAIVRGMAMFSLIMFGLAYLLSAESPVILAIVPTFILIGIGVSSLIKWWRMERAFREKEISTHRLEHKFELESANDEPAMARDMIEARGMVPDRGNISQGYYFNHSLYLDTPDLLTYYARENSYREYRFKARIRWYGDEELISLIESIPVSSDMDATAFIREFRNAHPIDSHLGKMIRATIQKLSKKGSEYANIDELKKELLMLAGQTENVHLEIKNRLDTRMWKFGCWARREAIPHILALAHENNDAPVDLNWLPEKDRNKPKSIEGLKQFCRYVREYRLTPTIQVSYERLAYENAPNARELLNRLIPLALEYKQRIEKGDNAEYWRTILNSPAGKYLRAILDSYETFIRECSGRDEDISSELMALAIRYRRKYRDELLALGFAKKNSDEEKREKTTAATEVARSWLENEDSPVAQYLYRILHPDNPNDPEIAVEESDTQYLRLTLDMNVRWRECDNKKNPTLFAEYKDFRRTWPGQTILEVKFKGVHATPWVAEMIETFNELRENKPIKDFPIRRQPAGKYCDSISGWLYWRKLKGDFNIFKERGVKSGLAKAALRNLGMDRGYPISPRSPLWAKFTEPRFDETFTIDPEKPYEPPYGMEPLEYAHRGHIFPEPFIPGEHPRDYENGSHEVAMLPVLSDWLKQRGMPLKWQSWIEQVFFGALNVTLIYISGIGILATGFTWATFVLIHSLPSWLGAKTIHSPPKWSALFLVAALNAVAFAIYPLHIGVSMALFILASVQHYRMNLKYIKTLQEINESSQTNEVMQIDRTSPADETPKVLLGIEKDMYTDPVREVLETYQGDVEVMILDTDEMDSNMRVLQKEAFSRGIPMARILKIEGMADVDVKIAVHTYIEEQLRGLFMNEFSEIISDIDLRNPALDDTQVKNVRLTLSRMASLLPRAKQMDLDIFIANASVWQAGSALVDPRVADTSYIMSEVKTSQAGMHRKKTALVITDAMLAVNPILAAQIAAHNAKRNEGFGTKHILTIFNPAIDNERKAATFLEGIGAAGIFDKVILHKDMNPNAKGGISRKNFNASLTKALAEIDSSNARGYEVRFVGGELHFVKTTKLLLEGSSDEVLNRWRRLLQNDYNDELVKIFKLDDKTVNSLEKQRVTRQDSEEYKEFLSAYYERVRSVLDNAKKERNFRMSA